MYIVIEIQTNVNGTVATLTNQYENLNDADSKYHNVLGFAAVSSLPKHACVMMTEEGFHIKAQCYKHDVHPEPEPELEPEELEIEGE